MSAVVREHSTEGPANTVGLNVFSPVSKDLISRFALSPPDLGWRPSTAYGIQRGTTPEMWHAGHVNAVVADGPVAIAGAETGGVWLINPAFGPTPTATFPARSLSWNWENPNVTTLAAGPDGPTIVFAGGLWLAGTNASLRVLEFAGVLGGLNDARSAEISLPPGMSVYQIVVQPAARRIVLASGSGVWWSLIPSDPMQTSAYRWRRASGDPAIASGIALGPSGTVVAAAYGDGVQGSSMSGFYVGSWSGSTLTMRRTAIVGAAAAVPAIRRTSIASSENHPSVLYAVAAGADDNVMGAVLRSADGGATFAPCQIPFDSGDQGSYNNCVAVHPDRPDVVAVGWRTGPFVSLDRGQTWTLNTDERTGGHMHADVHALTFAETADGVDLWAGTDGGLCRSIDIGVTWDSQYNKHLRNLQYYGAHDVGAMSPFHASRWVPGLYGGGTQDNGNLWTRSGEDGFESSVRQFEGGDGNTVMFVSETIVLHRNNTLLGATEFGNRIRRSNFNPATHEMEPGFGTVVPADGYPDGLPFPIAASVVVSPQYQLAGRRLLAVFGKGTKVHGYFDAAAPGEIKTLGDVGLGTTSAESPRSISALASFNGHTVLAATSDGHVYAVDAATGAVTEEAADLGGWAVTRLIWPAAHVRFATFGDARVAVWNPLGSLVFGAKPGVWTATSGVLAGGATGIAYAELESGASALFACTEFGVEVSIDRGGSWTDVSSGLPKRPHCRDICVGLNARGKPAVFVATYGWGVLLADLPGPPADPLPHIPSQVAEILFGVVAGGGGVELVNGHLHVVPPREPARNLAVGLTLVAMSQHTTGSASELTARAGEEMLAIAGIEDLAEFGQRMLATADAELKLPEGYAPAE